MIPDPFEFHGAKLAILSDDRIVTLLRDDLPDLPWPGYWDLPGGAREGAETPVECVLRETSEELGLFVDPRLMKWGGAWPAGSSHVWFFVAEWPEFDPRSVNFGEEGARWAFPPVEWYMTTARAIPSQRRRLAGYLEHRKALCGRVVRA